jgi:hypothetical protein
MPLMGYYFWLLRSGSKEQIPTQGVVPLEISRVYKLGIIAFARMRN